MPVKFSPCDSESIGRRFDLRHLGRHLFGKRLLEELNLHRKTIGLVVGQSEWRLVDGQSKFDRSAHISRDSEPEAGQQAAFDKRFDFRSRASLRNKDHVIDAALAWLRQEIDRDGAQNEYETYQLRDLFARFLRDAGRADELVAFFVEWDAKNPPYQTTYQQYLHALELANRTDEADALAKQWMVSGRVPGQLETADLMRLTAAVSYALGQRYQNYTNRISSAKDLDDFVVHLDKQAAETGQDSPLIRQKLGVVYAGKNEPQKAIAQFLAAIELQPNDLLTHAELIKAYDAVGDAQSAIHQTRALLEFDRHNLDLYKSLAERLKSDEALSERASTSVVEAAPNEAAHHQALAEFRQEQNRWEEAIEQWRHVARLRALEPNGLLKLTEALIHEKRWDEARESIGKLNQAQWPSRFNNVGSATERLQRQLPETSR